MEGYSPSRTVGFFLTHNPNGEGSTPPCVFSTQLDVNGEDLIPPCVFSMLLDANGEGLNPPHVFSMHFEVGMVQPILVCFPRQ